MEMRLARRTIREGQRRRESAMEDVVETEEDNRGLSKNEDGEDVRHSQSWL
jgi:hypothetical protein